MKGYQGIRRSGYQVKEMENFFVKEKQAKILTEDQCIPGFEKLWIWQKKK